MKIYLAQWHDRHTDDRFIAFQTLNKAKEQCHRWADTYSEKYIFEENKSFGEWCLFAGEDYYMAISQIEFMEY